MVDNRRYFFVKHGLDALQLMPNSIWNDQEKDEPRGFKGVKKGARWIGFAYTTSDSRERPLSQITGFYECTRESRFGDLPRKVSEVSGSKKAWMIDGKPYGRQPRQPVGVPSIEDEDLLNRPTFKQSTFVKINNEDEFERIRKYTLEHELDPDDIPFLGREPRNEQEVLAVVLCCHRKLGIEKILRVQTAFPDLLVNLKGTAEPVHLELETYSKSFLLHGHDGQVQDRRFKTDEKAEKLPVAVLCWIDNEKSPRLKKCVHHVYELQTLIRRRERIRWQR